MPDPFDVGYIVFVCIALLCFAGFYLWVWRGRFPQGQLAGFRLEEHRRQVRGAVGLSFPPLGVLALIAADRALDLCHLSHVRHAFWSGVIVSSDAWLLVFMIGNFVAAVRRFRAERASPRRQGLMDRT